MNDTASSLSDLSFQDMEDIIEVSLLTPIKGDPDEERCVWGAPSNFEGEPGIGKTQGVEAVAERLGLPYEPVFAGQHPPEDFSGNLIPDGKGGATQICMLAGGRRLLQLKYGVLMLDEVNGASLATQQALMSVLNERRIGDDNIPNHVRILTASNPVEIATGGRRFAPAFANRLFHFPWHPPTADEWAGYMMQKAPRQITKAVVTEQKIKDGWPDVYPTVVGLLTAFIKSNETLLHQRPKISDPRSGKAWPSHRIWEKLARAIATVRILKKGDLLEDAFIEAAVGTGAAIALNTYKANFDLPDVEDVLSGKWKPDMHRLDITMAAYSTAVNYTTRRPEVNKREACAVKIWKRLGDLEGTMLSDLIVPAADSLINAGLGRADKNGRPTNNKNLLAAASGPMVWLARNSGLQRMLEEAQIGAPSGES